MAHIAVLMTGLKGNLNASLELCSRLHNEGNKITYLAVRDVKKNIETYGFEYIQLPEIKFDINSKDLGFANKNFLSKTLLNLSAKEKILSKSINLLDLKSYETILKELNPDKVVIDKELHDLIFVCHSLQLPITLATTWFNHIEEGPQRPPIRTSLIPGLGFDGSPFKIWLSWLFINLKVKVRILLNKIYFQDYRRQGLLAYAKKNHFPIKQIKPTNLPVLFSYPSMNTISFNLKELDFPHKENKNFTYVGPMVFKTRENSKHHKIEEQLSLIFQKKEKENLKLIFCSVSTLVPGDTDFLKKLIAAIGTNKKFLLVITLGNKIKPSFFKNIPENVFLFSWVPQLKLLKNADCNINHGGINSINECIHFKVPMLIYSGGNFDQNGCAARIAYHKLGITGNSKTDTSKIILKNINQILDNPIYYNAMDSFNKKYLQYQNNNLSSLLS